MRKQRGFTLLEILVAMLIFTILSMMFVGGLRTLINAQSGTDINAERLRQLQFVLLMMSRDVEQTVHRSILDVNGKDEKAFIGTPRGFTFTHMGIANPMGMIERTSLERSRYYVEHGGFYRMTWPVLDQAPNTRPSSRILLNITEARFQYLDDNLHFHNEWPPAGDDQDLLPKAVKVTLTLPQWGDISQLYVLPSTYKTNAENATFSQT